MENKKMKENAFYKEDIIRIIVIIVVVVSAIVGTWIMVAHNYNENVKANVVHYMKISNNDVYQYLIEDNQIKFYDNEEILIATYSCISTCDVISLSEDDFIISSSKLVAISDNDTYILYDVTTQNVSYTYEKKPTLLGNSGYGIFYQDDKYGLVDTNGKIVLEPKYDFIDYVDEYFITVIENKITVLNSKFKQINVEPFDIEEYIMIETSIEGQLMKIRVTTIENKKISYIFKVK